MSKLLRQIAKVFTISITVFTCHAETIDFAVLSISPAQKAVLLKHEATFNTQHPNITISTKFYSDSEFKENINLWLESGNGPDILTWQAGMRLNSLVQQNLISDLSTVFSKYNLANDFSQSAMEAVSINTGIYAIPASYYQWGIYYRQSLFDKYNLRAPQDWQSLLKVCEVLKQNGITPITIGAKNKWTTAAWFDYLNLRINGLEFHRALLAGKVSFESNEVKKVFAKWDELLKNGCFTDRFNGWDWTQAMPFMYHNLAGATLIGNFFASIMPEALRDDFRFTPFPIIDPSVERYEEAPTEIFIVPHYASLSPAMETFIRSLAETNFQQSLNDASNYISPNVNVPKSQQYFIAQGQNVLSEAKGVSQFFDRDTNSDMAAAATEIFTVYLDDKNAQKAMASLESARYKYLSNGG